MRETVVLVKLQYMSKMYNILNDNKTYYCEQNPIQKLINILTRWLTNLHH